MILTNQRMGGLMIDKYEYIAETPEFAQFWAAYPRKQSKADAKKAWIQTAAIRPAMPELLKAVIAQKSAEAWCEQGGRFIPYPASWLRAEGWENSSSIELGDVVDGKMWHETQAGIISKGAELGIMWADEKWSRMSAQRLKESGATRHPWDYFQREVFRAAGHNVSQIKAA